MRWLKENIPHLLSMIGLILSTIGLFLIGVQLKQVNEHKRWENYNSLNLRYYEWYSEMPKGMDTISCDDFEKKSQKVKKWTRAYFNLYSEEYWLYLHNLIPKEMWTKRIDNGVNVNLVSYPVLVQGYNYWKKQGAFVHPKDFIQHVDKKLQILENKIGLKECRKK